MAQVFVPADFLAALGRMDARFVLLAKQHRPVVSELLAKLSHAQLCELARKLPFCNAEAAVVSNTVRQVNQVSVTSRLREGKFHSWLFQKARHVDAAVYVAAALQHALDKHSQRIQSLREEIQREQATALATPRFLLDSNLSLSLKYFLQDPEAKDGEQQKAQTARSSAGADTQEQPPAK